MSEMPGKLKWLWTIRVNGNAIRFALRPNRKPWRMRAISSFAALQSERSVSWKAEILPTTVGRRRARGRQESRQEICVRANFDPTMLSSELSDEERNRAAAAI